MRHFFQISPQVRPCNPHDSHYYQPVSKTALEEEREKGREYDPDSRRYGTIQQQKQVTLQAKDIIQDIQYYMKAAYERATDACIEAKECLHLKKSIKETAFCKLNFIIENTNMQFKAADQRFPEHHKEIFFESLRNMRNDFAHFTKTISFEYQPSDEDLNQLQSCFDKLNKVLNLEPITSTEVSRQEVDPLTIMPSVQKYYTTIVQSEKERETLKESHNISPLKPESSWK